MRRTVERLKRISAAALWLAVVPATYCGSSQVRAAVPTGAASTATSKVTRYTFSFSDADVALVADEVLGHTLNLPYSVDSGVTGKISFRVDRTLTAVQLLEAFEASLESADIVMVRNGDSFVLRSRARAKALAGLTATTAQPKDTIGYSTASVSLAYARPSEVAKTLQAISPTDPVVFVNDQQGLLVLGGSGETLSGLVKLAKTFDRSGLEASKIRLVDLITAPADVVSAELDKILSSAGFAGATVFPLKRLNAVLVFARTDQALDEVVRWISRLDVASKEKSATLFVYRPRNVSADSLATTLSTVVGSGGGGFTVSPSVGGSSAVSIRGGETQSAKGASESAQSLVTAGSATLTRSATDADATRIAADKDSNTLLIFATPARWLQIQRVLDDIDRPLRQVMVEASILEVTLNKQDSLGVDWSVIGSGGRLLVSSIYNQAGTIAAVAPGLSATYIGGTVKAAILALGSQGRVEVVSAPKILALDNHPARLDIGDQVPIVTQTGQSTIANGAPVVNAVDYRDTGIILKVTPRVSGDNRVALEVDQEVSSVSRTTTSGINSPTIQQRKIATSLILDSGTTVALGGLISSGKQYTDTGLPILKDIPGIGALFRTATTAHNRTELIVLLTARVVADTSGADRLTRDILDDMKELDRRGMLPR